MTIDIPFSRNELIVSGAGVALGIAEIVSPPVAVVVAVSPLIRRGIRAAAGSADPGTTRTATAHRRTTRRSTSSRSAGASRSRRARTATPQGESTTTVEGAPPGVASTPTVEGAPTTTV